MAQRITLSRKLAAGAQGPSIRIRLDDPPYLFVLAAKDENGATLVGSVAIEQSIDDKPDPQGLYTDVGVPDASAQWVNILTLTPGSQINWRDPLFRIRVNAANLGAPGVATVQMLAGVRSLKTQKPARVSKGKQYAARNGY